MRLYSPRVQLGFFKETALPTICTRVFYPLTTRSAGWVFTIDPQEDIAKMNNFRTLIEYAMRHTDNLHLASLYWTKGAHYIFPKRKPPRVVDAGAVGYHRRPDRDAPKMADLIKTYMETYEYEYGLDEILLEEWICSQYPEWFLGLTPGVVVSEGDMESDIELGSLEKIDPTMVKDRAQEFADFTRRFASHPERSFTRSSSTGGTRQTTNAFEV